MTVEFALDFIPRRMKELGYLNNYITRWREIQIEGNQTLIIEAYNEYYYLIKSGQNFIVQSKFGVNDLTDTSINEMQYEHRGKITIKNKTNDPQLIQLIQVIPKHCIKQRRATNRKLKTKEHGIYKHKK